MTARVFVHIGLPKTGTSYLQAILWSHREELRTAGLLLPGREKRDHLLASMIVRDDPAVAKRGPGAEDAWRCVRDDIAAHDGDALISHEFFSAADEAQARRMVDELAPREVHLVVTAREPLGIFSSSWQEHLKNKGTKRIEEYAREVSDDPRDVWNWRALDLGLVLERWGPCVPAERVHVIVAPGQDEPRSELWVRFCGVLGVDPGLADLSASFANQSLGVVEAETLRRVNERLGAFSGYERGRWIRSFLADQRLVPLDGERFWPDEQQIEDCRARARGAVDLVERSSYGVVGRLEALLVPDELPPRRHPSSVTDSEVADVAVGLAATLLEDLRDRSSSPGGATGERTRPRSRWRRIWSRLVGRAPTHP